MQKLIWDPILVVVMDDMFAYIHKLEVYAFFSGYPVIYALVNVLSTSWPSGFRSFFPRLKQYLPFGYALSGSLFLGLFLRDQFSAGSFDLQPSFLQVWSMLSILFWFPFFSRNIFFSLVHSLVIFFVLVFDLIQAFKGFSLVQNEMKVYTDSIILNAVTVVLVFVVSSVFKFLRTGR